MMPIKLAIPRKTMKPNAVPFWELEMGIWLTAVLSVAWSKLRTAIESDRDLRTAFLRLLTVLSARPVQDAVILRAKVTDALQAH